MLHWSGYNWATQERFGIWKPTAPDVYYSRDMVNVVDGELILATAYNPRELDIPETNSKVIVPISIGLVSCTTKFSYGYFEIIAKMPTGDNKWPAFWIYPFEDYLPEIDVFEGYSEDNDYKVCPILPFGFWNIQSNFHYKEDGKMKMLRGKKHIFGFKNPSERFYKYSCLWTPDKIEVYYNNILVRGVYGGKIIKDLRGKHLNVIINNNLAIGSPIDKFEHSKFIISNFKYVPLIPDQLKDGNSSYIERGWQSRLIVN
jgi:beta-glucanase (GH16 family)